MADQVNQAPAPQEQPAYDAEMNQVLTWIGFNTPNIRNRIMDDAFNMLRDLSTCKEADIRDLASGFAKRTQNEGRIIFGLRRTKRLIAMMHWVQDFYRYNEVPTLQGIETEDSLLSAIETAAQRANVRANAAEQVDTVSKAADPGKFKDESKWAEWEPAFVNYLSTIPGVDGVPLSYVVREDEIDEVVDDDEDFVAKTVRMAPLEGTNFKADAKKVHQLLKSFLNAETAEQWVKGLSKKQNGRLDMQALRRHYSGEGNTSRRITVAERIRDTLFYKSERAMSYESFLAKLQKMFNIFADEGEPMEESAKTRLLLKKIQSPHLSQAVAAVRIQDNLGKISFTEAANHIATEISNLNETQFVQSRRQSGVSADRGQVAPKSGVYTSDGSVWTGHLDHWNQLTKQEKKLVFDARKAKKNKGQGPEKGKKAKNATGLKAQIKSLQSNITDLSRKIAAIAKEPQDTDAEPQDGLSHNAGDEFGGRNKKRQKTVS